MTKREKADFIQSYLSKKYPHPEPPLRHSSPFTLLIAVLLSAQCTDARVNTVTPKLFKKARTAKKMAQLQKDDIYPIIQPCGLAPKKSKAIVELSAILVNQYDGAVPNSLNALKSLPGVGHKTASVVLAQSFGIPTFPVDTHIHRLAYRWGLSNGKNVETTERDLKRLFREEDWNDLHLQIIFFGREYCKAKPHTRNSCPLCSVVGRKSLP